MTLTDKEKINICKYWEANPMYIEDIVIPNLDEEDVYSLMMTIQGNDKELTLGKIEEYRRKLESHELQKDSHDFQKKQTKSYKKEITIVLITAVVSGMVSNIDRIIKWISSLL